MPHSSGGGEWGAAFSSFLFSGLPRFPFLKSSSVAILSSDPLLPTPYCIPLSHSSMHLEDVHSGLTAALSSTHCSAILPSCSLMPSLGSLTSILSLAHSHDYSHLPAAADNCTLPISSNPASYSNQHRLLRQHPLTPRLRQSTHPTTFSLFPSFSCPFHRCRCHAPLLQPLTGIYAQFFTPPFMYLAPLEKHQP